MKYYVLFIFTILVNLLPAQVPGYMGKKITLEYRPDVGMNILSGSFSNKFTVRHRLDIGYTVGRAMSLHLVFDNSQERYNISEDVVMFNGFQQVSNQYYFRQNRMGLGAYAAFYTRKSFGLAPLGVYATVGVYNLLPTKSNLRYAIMDTITPFRNTSTRITELPEIRKDAEQIKMRGAWSLGIGIGKRHLFAKRFLFDYGVNYYVFLGTKRISQSDYDFYSEQQRAANSIFLAVYKFHSYMGFGIIL